MRPLASLLWSKLCHHTIATFSHRNCRKSSILSVYRAMCQTHVEIIIAPALPTSLLGTLENTIHLTFRDGNWQQYGIWNYSKYALWRSARVVNDEDLSKDEANEEIVARRELIFAPYAVRILVGAHKLSMFVVSNFFSSSVLLPFFCSKSARFSFEEFEVVLHFLLSLFLSSPLSRSVGSSFSFDVNHTHTALVYSI